MKMFFTLGNFDVPLIARLWSEWFNYIYGYINQCDKVAKIYVIT